MTASRLPLPAIFGLSGPALTPDESAFFRDADPAGYILFARNVDTPDQVRALTDSLRALHGRDVLVLIDQEGGRVDRLAAPAFPDFPAAGVFADCYDAAPMTAITAARWNGRALGACLHGLGINVNCAPVLDVRQPGASAVVGDRALGSDPLAVAALGRAMLAGMQDAGVVGVIKHMPGHGRALVDSHRELPVVTADAGALEQDIAPFHALHDAAIGITAHVVYPAWDAARPATLSSTVIADIIRGRIGFDGLLLTDDLDMQALSGDVPGRAAAAQAAGCDLALNCWAKMDDMAGIAAVLAPMEATTLARLARVHALLAAAPEWNADAADYVGERDALLTAAS